MGGSSKKVTVGYKYFLGLHMVLCHGPIDKLIRIDVDEKAAWTGASTGGSITVNAPELFGGEKREGGVSGRIDVLMGLPTQGPNSYLQGRLGANIPSFRGVMGVVLNQCYIGLNPYLKRWAFWASRIHVRHNGQPQWYDAKAEIAGDMNPAHIIRECLTDSNWGMGYQDADIDEASFMASADQMFLEGMGMSLLWDKSVVLEEFLQIVLKHIDGTLYVDRTTGRFVLKLARGGYDVSSLLVLDETSIERITDYKRNTMGELVNSVTVVYWDASTGKNNSITVQDIALVAQQQTVISTTKQFPGFTNGTLASKVAARSLKALSVPLASATIYSNRKAAALNVGDVFVLNWPRYGVTGLVMRVANVELGALGSNAIKIQCIEDVFALSNAVYAAPPPSGWVDPNSPPAPCRFHYVMEAPYWELVQRVGEVEARNAPATSGAILATGVRPSGDATNASLYSKPLGTWEESGTVDFCPTAVLGAAVPLQATSTVIALSQAEDVDLVPIGSYAAIGEELVRVDAISESSLTVGRGVLDTVPQAHPLGTRVFFPDVYVETDQIEYLVGENAQIRILPTTGLGTLPLDSAPIQTKVITGRHAKPYAPGQFKIDGRYNPADFLGSIALTVSWAHRNRILQTATLIDSSFGSISVEPDTTYTCQLLKVNNSVIATHTGLTGENDSFTLLELGANVGPMKVQLWAVRDGLASHQMHEWTITRLDPPPPPGP